MAELRRDRPDQPPDQPGKPDRSGDRPRLPVPEPGTNRDPETIRRVMRASDHPAFADPRYEPRPRVERRYVTNADAATARDPSRPIFYETSQRRPEPKADKAGSPDARTHQVDRAREASQLEAQSLTQDRPGRSRAERFNKALVEKAENVRDATRDGINSLEKILDRPKPTGQYTRSRPDDHDATSLHAHVDAHGFDLGLAVASMLTTGIAIGESAMRKYRKAVESREGRHAGNR